MAYLAASALCLFITPWIIRSSTGFTSQVKDELVTTQGAKKGTCTLGSIPIFISFTAAAFISQDALALRMTGLCLPFFLIGLADDSLKAKRRSADGFKSLTKLILQLVASIFTAFLARDYAWSAVGPFIYYPMAVLFIAATVNAYNITDGLDGLAVKSCLPMLILVAAAVPGLRSANLVLASVLVAFLAYNSKPAGIFMGDGGSHFIGAFIALNALVSGEVLGVIIAVLPIYLEMLSSLIQIISFRLFGRRVFKIAPFHHELELRGMAEAKIVDLFFVTSALTSLLAALFCFKVV